MFRAEKIFTISCLTAFIGVILLSQFTFIKKIYTKLHIVLHMLVGVQIYFISGKKGILKQMLSTFQFILEKFHISPHFPRFGHKIRVG